MVGDHERERSVAGRLVEKRGKVPSMGRESQLLRTNRLSVHQGGTQDGPVKGFVLDHLPVESVYQAPHVAAHRLEVRAYCTCGKIGLMGRAISERTFPLQQGCSVLIRHTSDLARSKSDRPPHGRSAATGGEHVLEHSRLWRIDRSLYDHCGPSNG